MKSVKFFNFEQVIGKLCGELDCSEVLSNREDEAKIWSIELSITQTNLELIRETAKLIGKALINTSNLPSIETPEKACFARYIIVPILYKLGMTEEAAKLNQDTFAFLFSTFNDAIQTKIEALFGPSVQRELEEITNSFNENEWPCYSRIKSNHSIWKKVTSIENLQAMNLEEFCLAVDDFIAVRWRIKPSEDENRYDAVIRGINVLPHQASLYKIRNQFHQQDSGFCSEPVVKALFIINKFPVELQILGGNIEWYMCAKGYSNYKVGLELTPSVALDNTDIQNARLGTCIYFQENALIVEFRQLMLAELVCEEGVVYDETSSYITELSPLAEANKQNKIVSSANLIISEVHDLLLASNDIARNYR